MTTVTTTYGQLSGEASGGVHRFLGIPFAAPPVGGLRFRPPAPPQRWDGVREATSFGPVAPQLAMDMLPGMQGMGAQDEDCLYLNVWTPAPDDAKRPVMVWIHGGAFIIGSGSQEWYESSRMAARGDVVVVTVNYRLGALGFLHLSDLCGPEFDGCSNLGIQDQVAALRWVADNIAAFGGDPDNVTIFGESAGGMSVGTLLGFPSARGLFRRAIAQSGAASNALSAAEATEIASKALAAVGVDPEGASEALRALSLEQLLSIQAAVMGSIGESAASIPFQPVVDGVTLPAMPVDSVRTGMSSGVDVMAGSNADEFKLFAFMSPPVNTDADLVDRLDKMQDGHGSQLVDAYRAARSGRGDDTSPGEIWSAILTDLVFRIPAVRLLEAQRGKGATYSYLFTWPSPMAGGTFGSCHALEIPFVFGTLHTTMMNMFAGDGPEAAGLSETMMDLWTSFARDGRPSASGAPDWPVYEAPRRATMILDTERRIEDDPLAAERRAWDGVS